VGHPGKYPRLFHRGGEIETLVIPRDGTYLVNAFAATGATNYILAIGAYDTVNALSKRHYNIVPWQTVVKYREDGPSTDMGALFEISQGMGLEQRAGGGGRGRLMALRQGLISALQQNKRLGAATGKHKDINDPDLRARWETLLAIKSLRGDPRVEYAEPNYEIRALAVPDDEAYPFQWHYPLIGLPEAWDTTTGNSDVVVAVIDTGILSNHPDLAGQLVDGFDFVRDPASAGDGDGIDPDPEDSGNPPNAGSSSFHGTHVSGTVAARGNNGLGVAGTAYTSHVMPVRALGAGGAGTSYDVSQAIRFAAGLPNDSGTVPLQAADIINLSLGGGPFSQASQDLFDQVRAAGVMVVAAAGNEASPLPAYPASYSGVISVSAVDAQRRLAPYSNTGGQIEVDTGGLGTYRVSVDRNELQPGVYSADIIAQSSVNDLRVRVILSLGGEGAAADVGVIYVLLYDAVLNEVVAQFTTAADKGKYPFEFSNIPPGQYEIVAGSDADNDLFICDPGEACGAWLTVDQPILIALESDIGNINFPIEYLVSIPSITGNTQSGSSTESRRARLRGGKGIAKPRSSTDD
jgi:hypothetical protein